MAKTQKDQTIKIKTAEEIAKMRVAGKLAAEVLEMIGPYVKPGVTTGELDQICHNYIVNVQQAIPAPLNYGEPPFPRSICTSVNHVICHGIPGDKKLKEGDALNIDITVIKDGYHGDTSKMFFVGEPSIAGKRLSQITQQCLYRGILEVHPGAPLGNIGKAIQKHAHANRYSVVEEFCGHGIGNQFHESPQILHYYSKDSDKIIIQPGMIFTIEPMINQGKRHLKILPDQWTAVTKDHKLSAQWEHTILVTEDGFEILTLREEEADWRATV
ncbi:type I methionyl aminopeptidase [Thiothrix nivea]|uniref:Methionine aminopeptidase n=1 Tax=Thiothrix nivea (strain ATCC 35100 / DSM 5205 / JP2) TaxID=870187 RepID=A0A656HJQ9_THINJ|nr:type I methionyl aminopeptidase [Thiothrix nivea]EIJ36462.1 methionine aminopeptidase, type I [Thiothrix nivea DSM 5205]